MAISFDQIPNTQRLVAFSTEIKATAGVAAPFQFKVLLVGAGSKDVEVTRFTTLENARSTFGDEQTYSMLKAFHDRNNHIELYGIQKAITTGTKAQKVITVSSAATEAGEIALYVNDIRIPVPVKQTDSTSMIAISIAAALKEKQLYGVIVSSDASTVTIANSYNGNYDLFVSQNRESTDVAPAGLELTVVSTAGVGTIDYGEVVSSLDEERYEIIVVPDKTKAVITDLIDEVAKRWNALSQLDGFILTSSIDTFANLVTLGETYNSQYLSILGVNGIETPSHILSSAATAVISTSIALDPARPLQTLEIPGLRAPRVKSRFLRSEGNSMLFSGITPLFVSPSNRLQFVNTITTYRTDSSGVPDLAYLNVASVFVYTRLRYEWNVATKQRYPRAKLVSNDSRPNPRQQVATPQSILVLFSQKARDWEGIAWINNSDALLASAAAEVNRENPNRVDISVDVRVVGQLEVLATQLGVRLA